MTQIIIFNDYNASTGPELIINPHNVKRTATARKAEQGIDTLPVKTSGAYVIAGVLRANGYSVKVVDHLRYLMQSDFSSFVKKILDSITNQTIVIGFSVTFMNTLVIMKELAVLIKLIKNKHPNIKFVVGGHSDWQATKLFDDVGIDFKISGLGESNMLNLCNSLSQGKQVHRKSYIDMTGTEYNFHETVPAFDKTDLIRKGEALPIEISRGCRFKCKFCSYFLLGRNPKDEKYIRSRYSLSKEFEYNYEHFGTTDYIITCDTFNETIEKLEHVHAAIQDVGIKIDFGCFARLELLHAHRTQVDLLKEMGLRAVFFGIESLHTPSAKAIGKGLSLDQKIEILDHLNNVWQDQVNVHGNFIVGLPYETEETVSEWTKLLLDGTVKLDSANYNPLAIKPDISDANFLSEFDTDPGKYGYEFDNSSDKNWKSPTMTYQQAVEIQYYWQPIIDKHLESSFLTFTYVSARNLGLSYSEIENINRYKFQNDPQYAKPFHDRILNYYKNYSDLFYST